jgi:hypothetical protein
MIIKRWRRRGFMIYNEKPRGRGKFLTQEQIQWLVSADTLKSMSHLSLKERIPQVLNKFGM